MQRLWLFLSYNKNYSNKIDEELEKRFKNTLRRFLLIMISIIFFVIKKRCLFLWVHGLVKFDETSFPKKEEFHSNLNMKDANHMHAKRICENFEIENIGKYYNLYRYLYITRYFWKLQKIAFKNLSFRSCKISLSSGISMANSFKKVLEWSID